MARDAEVAARLHRARSVNVAMFRASSIGYITWSIWSALRRKIRTRFKRPSTTIVIVLALATPLAAVAQPALFNAGNPMTQPVTPRDIPWYMAHPNVLNATLGVCHSNAAYGPTADCQNAERASRGVLAGQQQQAANQQRAGGVYSSQWWDQNPIMRETVITQCNRRGPGDQIAYPYCALAAASKLRSIGR
jgi:hypothetical protein